MCPANHWLSTSYRQLQLASYSQLRLTFRVACLCSNEKIILISWSSGFHVLLSSSSFWFSSFSNFGSGHHHILVTDFLGKVILIVWAKLSSFLWSGHLHFFVQGFIIMQDMDSRLKRNELLDFQALSFLAFYSQR